MLWWSLRRLRSRDEWTRCAAAERLGRYKDPRACEALLSAVQDDSAYVRAAAAHSLFERGDNQDSRTVDLLLKALERRPVPQLTHMPHPYGDRTPILRALGRLGDMRAIEPLVAMLGAENNDVRRSTDWIRDLRIDVAAALGELGGTLATTALVKALNDWNGYVRHAAVGALIKCGAVELTIPALHDSSGNLYEAVIAGILASGNERTIAPLLRVATTNKWRAESAVGALIKIVSCHADAATLDDLSSLAGLEKITQCYSEALYDEFWTNEGISCPSPTTTVEREIDCSHLATLARQELLRRSVPLLETLPRN